MKSVEVVSRVSERDVDHIMLEEFSCSPEFVHFFLRQIEPSLPCPPARLKLLKAERSRYDNNSGHGETDIELKLEFEKGYFILLIENKVAAGLGASQAERYSKRAEVRKSREGVIDCKTVLLSPENYRKNNAGFDAHVSYEAIIEWFISNAKKENETRYSYKMARLEKAISKTSKQSKGDGEIINFRAEFAKLAKKHAPLLKLDVDEKTTSQWINFLWNGKSSLPFHSSLTVESGKRITLYFKPVGNKEDGTGTLEIWFEGMVEQRAEIERIFDTESLPGIDIRITGRRKDTLQIRLFTPPINVVQPIEEQRQRVRKVLALAEDFLEWYLRKSGLRN